MRGRRLIVLFFDLSSMQPEDVQRAVDSAHEYVEQKLSPADLIAVASVSTSLQRRSGLHRGSRAVLAAHRRFGDANGQRLRRRRDRRRRRHAATTATRSPPTTPSSTSSTTTSASRAEDAGRRAGADRAEEVDHLLQQRHEPAAARTTRSSCARTVDRAVRANVSIYAARHARAAGDGARRRRDARAAAAAPSHVLRRGVAQQFAQPGGVAGHADDAGGGHRRPGVHRLATTSAQVFDAVVSRHVGVLPARLSAAQPGAGRPLPPHQGAAEARPPQARVARPATTPTRDFAHTAKDDREQQLQDQLLVAICRRPTCRVFVDGVLPARRQIATTCRCRSPCPATRCRSRSRAKDKATLDVLGVVRDEQRRPVGRIRDTVKLPREAAR